VALNKETGAEVWRRKDAALAGTWSTPTLVDCGNGWTDLVLAIPFKVWGINPDTGELRWHCEGLSTDSMCTSAVARDGVVYVLETGPRGGGTMAVRAGGEGDVSKTHVVWRGKERSRIGTPIVEGGRIYWFGARTANCVDAATGSQVYQTRLGGDPAPGTPGAAGSEPRRPDPGGPGPGGPGPGGFGPGPGGRGPGGRFGGGMGGQDYSSPVLVNGNIYFVSRGGETFVYTAGSDCKLLGQNRFADGGDFSATPAVSEGQLFIRSSKFLYCVANSAR
jgi:hypothetical protein